VRCSTPSPTASTRSDPGASPSSGCSRSWPTAWITRRRFGGSGWAAAGAVLGAIVGIFFGLPGLVLGPLLGALAAEYAYTRRLGTSARAALGTVVGLLVGAVAKIGLGLTMIGLFLFWVWRG
jgi:uncharacterized protein YqgC (DUF456 family)